MQFPVSSILAATSIILSGVTASPINSEAIQSRDPQCGVIVKWEKTWSENAMRRRRVSFETNKIIDPSEYEKLGKKWSDGKEKCSAVCNNKQVYYHDGVTDHGAWVVDSNEVLGAAGDNAHKCLMGRFKDMLSRELGCQDES